MEPGHKKTSNDSPSPTRALEYATYVGENPEPRKHSALGLLIIGIAALAGIGSVVHGLCYVVDYRFDASLLIAGGCASVWAALGYLPAPSPRFKHAFAILSIALACEVIVVKHAQDELSLQESLHGKIQANAAGEIDAVYHAEIIRNGAILWTLVAALAWSYSLKKLSREGRPS